MIYDGGVPQLSTVADKVPYSYQKIAAWCRQDKPETLLYYVLLNHKANYLSDLILNILSRSFKEYCQNYPSLKMTRYSRHRVLCCVHLSRKVIQVPVFAAFST